MCVCVCACVRVCVLCMGVCVSGMHQEPNTSRCGPNHCSSSNAACHSDTPLYTKYSYTVADAVEHCATLLLSRRFTHVAALSFVAVGAVSSIHHCYACAHAGRLGQCTAHSRGMPLHRSISPSCLSTVCANLLADRRWLSSAVDRFVGVGSQSIVLSGVFSHHHSPGSWLATGY